jgi:hypothetical protein
MDACQGKKNKKIMLFARRHPLTKIVTGKSAGCPAFLPVSRGGEESRPYNCIYISRKPRPVGVELHSFDVGSYFDQEHSIPSLKIQLSPHLLAMELLQ